MQPFLGLLITLELTEFRVMYIANTHMCKHVTEYRVLMTTGHC